MCYKYINTAISYMYMYSHTFLGGGGGLCSALFCLSASLPEALSYLT